MDHVILPYSASVVNLNSLQCLVNKLFHRKSPSTQPPTSSTKLHAWNWPPPLRTTWTAFITTRTQFPSTFRFPSRPPSDQSRFLDTPTANRLLPPQHIRVETLFAISPQPAGTIQATDWPIAAIGASTESGNQQTCQSWSRHDIYSERIAIFFPTYKQHDGPDEAVSVHDCRKPTPTLSRLNS